MAQGIIACPYTLSELINDPDLGLAGEDYDDRRNALGQLKSLIDSSQVKLYILPTLLPVIHAYYARSANENFANRCIVDLLALGNCNLDVDHQSCAVETIDLMSRACQFDPSIEVAFYEALMLTTALNLRVELVVVSNDNVRHHLNRLSRCCLSSTEIFVCDVQQAVSYLSSIESGIFSSERKIYVSTPAANFKSLKKGATVIDFAYAVHTEVGNKCFRATVNGEAVSLDRVLKNRDVVEVEKAEHLQVNESWLGFAATRLAKKAIKHSIRKTYQDRGWDMLKQSFNLSEIRTELDIVAQNKNKKLNELIEEIGRELFSLDKLSDCLQEISTFSQLSSIRPEGDGRRVLVGANTEEKYQLSRCCMPFPDDLCVGILSKNGNTIRIHRKQCNNLANVREDRLISTEWICQECHVELAIIMKDRRDTLRKVLNCLAESGIISDLRKVLTTGGMAHSKVTLPFQSRSEMLKVIDLIKIMPHVSQVRVCEIFATSDIKAE
ncbi:MAG: TGS domain-containing protein [Cyanobacteria bacterium P01_D01_bin.71]